MDKYKNMQLFCTVVEKGSFAKAAKMIGVTPAIIGRRIAALENELGFVLLNRTTRSMHLTSGGESYYEGAKEVLESVVRLEDSLTKEHKISPAGLVRISAPDALGSPFLLNAIKSFGKSYPDIRFDLSLNNSHTNLIKEEIDLSFRLSFNLQDSSHVAKKMGNTTFGLYASPQYLEKNGTPTHFKELEHHDCIHMSTTRYGGVWNLQVDGKNVTYRQPWKLIVSNSSSLIHSIVSGMGIGLVPSMFVKDLIDKGDIVEIKGLTSFPVLSIYAIYPTRKHVPHRLRLFIDFLTDWFPQNIL